MKNAIRWLEKALAYHFQDAELLQQALSHRSATHRNNERLEFLGDAVLDFAISEHLYRMFPDASEGDLSKLRSTLVKDVSLAALAVDLGLGDHLILGSGEMKTGGHRRESILADAFEAVIAAIFLDGGIDACRQVIDRAFSERLQNMPDLKDLRDSKTRLQEWLQAHKLALPEYALESVTGADHKQRFTVTCTVAEKTLTSKGEAGSRRKAEQKAAAKMIGLLEESQP